LWTVSSGLLSPASPPWSRSRFDLISKRVNGARELTIVSTTAVVSILNYAYTLVLVWMLPARDYAVVGSASALLLICGTISAASVPWVLAREIARARDDQEVRRAAVSFCVLGTLVESVIVGAASSAVAASYGSGAAVATVFGSVVAIFSAATVIGYLQGLQSFATIAVLGLAEVVTKIIAGVLLVVAGAGAAGAITGFALGGLVIVVVGGARMLPDLRFVRKSLSDNDLWRTAGGLMAIQAGVAVVASLDIVVGSIMIHDRPRLATYEVAQILARVPVYIGTALSMVVFPRLVAADGDKIRATRNMLRLYWAIAAPCALVAGTLPRSLATTLFPQAYGSITAILGYAAIGGVGMGAINLGTTFLQAASIFRRPSVGLGLGVVMQLVLVVIGIRVDSITGLAIFSSAGAVILTAVILREIRRAWTGSTRHVARAGLATLALASPLIVLRDRPALWLAWVVVGVGVPILAALLRFRRHIAAAEEGRPRVLHLGYEDPRRPGGGGGSVRTHEINRRLAADFDITVVCARYPGSAPYEREGVRYVHVGLPLGRFASIIAYFCAIPYALVRWDSDLVVEDFGAPLSSVAVPWLTRRPVVGVVQWLFAAEKARQYHLPFQVFEALGVRSHRQLIAVSDDLADAVRLRNPRAQVTVVSNGLDDRAFTVHDAARNGIVYLGRLEIAQKGLDLLLDAYAQIAHATPADLYLAGDGPDGAALRARALEAGVADRVHFLGRIAYERRFELLASAQVVAMPSRYETFGMVAAEALACATPVVAFDIPSLRSLVTCEDGIVVPPGDTDGFARALARLVADADLATRLGEAGSGKVSQLRWDRLAPQQAAVYWRCLLEPGRVLSDGPDDRPVLDAAG
jgi:glycosyltransferase involved in cell wall biosynthesis/O-antigen/teichoic acid export membrane protein